MKSLISFFTLLFIKSLSKVFYRYEIDWPQDRKINWSQVRLIVLLNHTSLFEVLYVGFLPISFLWMLSRKMVLPVASKTLDRPFVGFLFKIFSPGMSPLTRKRDDSWHQFLESIHKDSIIIIAPEGRMKRKNGLDLKGNKMTVRPGVTEILATLGEGQMIFGYSGGLHHIQVPGEGWPHVFRQMKMNLDVMDIAEYKSSFIEQQGSQAWKKEVLDDMQHRLETKPPRFEDRG